MARPLTRRFFSNEYIEGVGITIIECKNAKGKLYKTVYIIKHDCCGELDLITHGTIRKKMIRFKQTGKVELCRNCAKEVEVRVKREARKAKELNKNLNFLMPNWEVPDLVMEEVRKLPRDALKVTNY